MSEISARGDRSVHEVQYMIDRETGRRRSDRSVRASRERLQDEEPIVAWQALRNLGAFEERAAARDVARLLDHEATVVRAAAAAALVRMGAPDDTGYDPIAARCEAALDLAADSAVDPFSDDRAGRYLDVAIDQAWRAVGEFSR